MRVCVCMSTCIWASPQTRNIGAVVGPYITAGRSGTVRGRSTLGDSFQVREIGVGVAEILGIKVQDEVLGFSVI